MSERERILPRAFQLAHSASHGSSNPQFDDPEDYAITERCTKEKCVRKASSIVPNPNGKWLSPKCDNHASSSWEEGGYETTIVSVPEGHR